MQTVSVVIPTRDTRDLTLRAVGAVLAAVPAPDEVIVVDDGSVDGSGDAIAAAYPTVVVRRRDGVGGFTQAVNDGWRTAAGDLVLLLNSDTVVDVGAIGTARRAFAADPRLGIAGASLVFPDGRPQWSAGVRPTPRWCFVMASGLATALAELPGYRRLRPEAQGRDTCVDWVPATAMVVRREVQQQIGVFDAAYRTYVQDLAYCLSAGRAGWAVRQLREMRVTHLRGATIGSATVGGVPEPLAMADDLAHWLATDVAPREAGRCASALAWGWRVRAIGRDLARVWLRPRAAREAWHAETARYRAAAARIAAR